MTLQPDDLLGCWLDSREENVPESGIKIYRPCDYPDIPPSRFRFRMELNKDKTCSWLTLSPTDAHYMSKGYWHMEDGNKIVLRNNKGVDVHILPVYSVGQGILKIQEETPSSSDQ